jgi:hypothetical protein
MADQLPTGDRFGRLDQYRWNYSSRDGEDGIVKYLIDSFTVKPCCVEVGASDGKTQSNTLYLREKRGWEALLIEPPGASFEKLKTIKEDKTHIVCGFIEHEGDHSLDTFCGKFFSEIGVLSLDIDGNELEIFQNMKMRPSIVVIEYNRSFPCFIDYQDPPSRKFFRHSAKAVERVARGKGYRPVAVTKDNVVLLDEKLIVAGKESLVPNLPVEALFDFKKDSKLRYNGLLIGCKQYTTRYVFTKKPNFMMRLINIALTAHALYKQLYNRKRHLQFSIPEDVCLKIENSGLYL